MTIDLGLLVLRVVAGLLLAGHGAQKLFGWFGGHGLRGFAGMLEAIGVKPARPWAVLAGLGEFVGGILFALGLLNPLGPLAIIAVMLVAIAKVHWAKGLWITEGGMEYNLLLLMLSAVIGLTGPGSYALDSYFGIALPMPVTFWVGLLIVLVMLGVGLALKDRLAISGRHPSPTA